MGTLLIFFKGGSKGTMWAIPFYIHTPPLLTSFSEGAKKVVSEGLMRPLPLVFAAFSEGFEEKFVFFCGGKEKSVNF